MNTIDNDIPNLYKLEFERSLPGCNIYCDILPQYQSICFVHCQREILHAIELCFKENNIPTNFKDGLQNKKTGKAGIFAGSLELVKEGNLNIKQKDLFEDIYIKEIK